MNPEISSPPSDSTQAPEVPTGNVPLSHVSTSEVPQEDETTRRHVGRQAIGEAQALLAGFLGTLAADCKLFPMDHDRWSAPLGVPITYFDDCFETILKSRFYFKINEAGAKRYCKLSMGRKWVANRQNLWNEFNDLTKTRDEIIKNVSIDIDKDQWARFVHYHHKPSTLFLEIGKLPSRGQLYIETHKRKDGSFVNKAAKTIAEQIEVGLTQSIVDESEVSPLDVVGRVLGLEHSGRPNDVSSVPNTPLDARGSSGASNP
ncbi:hypothetical protein HKD37_06G016343 [Glycine soja]